MTDSPQPSTSAGVTATRAQVEARWLEARGPAGMRFCPRCQKPTAIAEVRALGTVLASGRAERVVQKYCQDCGQFWSQTVLPPVEDGR